MSRPPPGAAGEPARRGAWACYRRGLLSDLGNPKMAVFFTSLLPQFGARFAVLALLGLVFCAMTFLWLACYAVAIAKMGDLPGRSPVRRALDAVTGTVLVALGVKLAAEQP
jgi:threonine/homoserine/homoserine lactone efflux protein